MQEVRVRFAPSPTGYLHIGSLRTALYNYLFAKNKNGKFILRIEDTDRTRYVEGAVENLIETLKWAEISYDEGPLLGDGFESYFQSERLSIYKKYAQQLVDQSDAYYCFCTIERLEQIRQRQIALKLPPAYDRHCRNLDKSLIQEKLKNNESFVIRMKIPLEGSITFTDIIRGEITIEFKNLDDQVLIKSDGFPTYHLAVVVDDHLMKISHVIRGEEWLSSTPKHLLLYKYFNWKPTLFAHLPLLLNMDRTKLSKRQGDVAVEDYRKNGYLKEALINFIALLGWNPGDTQEIFSLEELIKKFSLDQVNKSGAVFDSNKLDWINGLYIRKKSANELINLIEIDVDPKFKQKLFFLDNNQLIELIDQYKDRSKTLKELEILILNLDKVPTEYDKKGMSEFVNDKTSLLLEKIKSDFEKLDDWNENQLSILIKNFCKINNIKLPEISQPLRLAITGSISSPGINILLTIFGKNESLKRLNIFLEFIKSKKE